MPENPPETPNYGFPIMSEADDDYIDLWHLILEDGGPTGNEGLIEPLDEILDGIETDVDANASGVSQNASDIDSLETGKLDASAYTPEEDTHDAATGGTMIDVDGQTVNHADTSSQSDVSAGEGEAVTEVELDSRGHLTGVGTSEVGGGDEIPSGLIAMWSGSISGIPSGWVLCDGNNGTPDLQDRFIVGAGGSYSVDDTGGTDEVQLSTSEMPSHDHELATNDRGGGGNFAEVPYQSDDSWQSWEDGNIDSTGGDDAHENRPPYYALAFMMKA